MDGFMSRKSKVGDFIMAVSFGAGGIAQIGIHSFCQFVGRFLYSSLPEHYTQSCLGLETEQIG